MEALIAAGLAPEPVRRAERGWRLRGRQALAILALVAGAAYLVFRVTQTAGGAWGWTYWPLLVAEVLVWLDLLLLTVVAWRLPASDRPPVLGEPTVDLVVTTLDEPVPVVHATLLGCRALRYPHRTWLLDDGQRPAMRALAATMGARYLARATPADGKAGSVNAALAATDADLVVVLDADQVPFPHLLDVTVGYFDDHRVGAVQTRLDFVNRDSASHSRPDRHEQSLFYDVLAPGRERLGGATWNGSAAVLRRRALLEIGGVRTDTVAEDLHTSIALHAVGWRTHHHDETLVQGQAPRDLESFLLQRERAARGHLRVLRTGENPLWCPGLTLRQRLSYLAFITGHLEGVRRLTFAVVLLLTLVTGLLPLVAPPAVLAAVWAPWAVLSIAAAWALGRGARSPVETSRFGWLTMGVQVRALSELVARRAVRFVVVPKEGVDPGGPIALRYTKGLVVLTATLVGALALRLAAVVGVVHLPPLDGAARWAVLTAAAIEALVLLGALRWVVRRRQLRHEYRYPVQLSGRVGDGVVRVTDLSVGGACVMGPVSTEPGTTLELRVVVPDSTGTLHELVLPAVVRSARHRDGELLGAGVEFGRLPAAPRDVLVEYLAVVRSAEVVGLPPPPARWRSHGRPHDRSDSASTVATPTG